MARQNNSLENTALTVVRKLTDRLGFDIGELDMDLTFDTILHLIVWGGGIYLYVLIVKALKKYINSDKKPKDK